MSGYPAPIAPVDHVEPVPRRVRGELAGQIVLDSTRTTYLWEWPYYPQFHIPADDVDPVALVDEQRTHRLSRGTVTTVGLRVGGTERPKAGRRYLDSSILAAGRHDPLRLGRAGRLV